MRALMLIAALVTAAYAQAETPTRLYRTGYDDVEAKHYVALFRYEGECQTAANNALTSGVPRPPTALEATAVCDASSNS